MPIHKKDKILAGAAFLLLLLACGSTAYAAGNSVLKFEWCRGACDRAHKNLGEWGTQFMHPPQGERCSTVNGILNAMEWIKQHEPSAKLAGWGCVRYDSQL